LEVPVSKKILYFFIYLKKLLHIISVLCTIVCCVWTDVVMLYLSLWMDLSLYFLLGLEVSDMMTLLTNTTTAAASAAGFTTTTIVCRW